VGRIEGFIYGFPGGNEKKEILVYEFFAHGCVRE
jgi:hypothetical protein